MGISQTPSGLKVTLSFPHSYWIGRGHSPQMNGKVVSTQWLPSMPAKTMGSEEAILSILNYPVYKCRTEDLEGDLDSEQWEEDG